jgi:predicted permease
MSALSRLRSWWRARRDPAGLDRQLREELEFHVDRCAEDLVRDGLSPDAARQRARAALGSMPATGEDVRAALGLRLGDEIRGDLRYALRMLRRSPGFTIVAVLSLGLGIGANTAIFSLADAVIFRKLPVREPDRLLQVRGVRERSVQLVFSYPMYRDIRDRNQVFTSTAAAGSFATADPIALDTPGRGRRELYARVTLVSGNYFPTLGIDSIVGRTLTPEDDRAPGAHPVAVVSHRFWKRALDADPGATRTRLIHNGISYAIVGVASAGFTGISSNDDPEIWFPMMMADSVLMSTGIFEARRSSSMYVFGRLKDDVDETAAAADLARLFADALRIYPDRDGPKGDVLSMSRGVQALRARFEKPLFMLLGVVGVLLLIACANLAALLLARAAARRHEIAVRQSLGASRFRLLRQFLTESVLIAMLGGAAGLAVSAWAASLLIEMVTTGPRILPIAFTIDSRILLFTSGISILAAVVFGIFPALQANRTPLAHAVQSAARTPSRLAGGRLLIATQMGLSLFLLIGSGLFIRSLGNLRQLDTGFGRESVLVLMMDVAPAYGNDAGKYLAMYRELTPRIEQLPGVRSASFARETFFSGNVSRGNIAYQGQPGEAPRGEWPYKVRITPRFPETFGLSLMAGRTFSDRDDRRAPKVAIVSESIAKRNFPGENPVGRRLCFCSRFTDADPDAIEIVGVVRDVRYGSLREVSPFTVYLPVEQQPASHRSDLHVRTEADPRQMAAQVQDVVRRFNPQIRMTHTTTLERLVEDSIVQDRLLAALSTASALLALMLAVVGLYGITSYGVQRRTNEIGVRMALGASPDAVRWMVLREVLWLATAGAAIGIPAALAASGLVRSLLFDLTPVDPVTIAIATSLLILVAAIAGFFPARRATRIDPIAALRVH